ncbi:MAG: hypothetical protein ACREX5_05515, partial [Achromobacter pestifer]
ASKRTRYEFLPDMARIDRFLVPEISDRSYSITTTLKALRRDSEGVVFCWGSRFAGFVLYAQGGQLVYEYVYTESVSYRMNTDLPVGDATVEIRFTRQARNAGRMEMLVDGVQKAALDLPKMWRTYSTTAGLTCGLAGVPLSEHFKPPFRFQAQIERVVVELADDGSDHREAQAWTVFKQQ